MRRRLRKSLPSLTRFYGIKPWELADFTVDELNEYQRQYRDYLRAQERAQRGR